MNLTFEGHVLFSPNMLPIQYSPKGVFEGPRPVPLSILPCLTVVNGQMVQMHSPPHHNAPMFFAIHPGVVVFLVLYPQGYVEIAHQRL